jgi:hypothetical protein
VFDINWSNDGTVVAAGFEKSVVMLDMRKILSTPVDQLMKQASVSGSLNPTLSSLGPSGDGGSGQQHFTGLNGSKNQNKEQGRI